MRCSNKMRLLLILHLSGVNLLVLGKVVQSRSLQNPNWVSPDSKSTNDNFPTLPRRFLPLNFSQNVIPLNSSHCEPLKDDNSDWLDVICTDLNDADNLEPGEYPDQVRTLVITNSTFTELPNDAFEAKKVFILEIIDNKMLVRLDDATFTNDLSMLLALVIFGSGLKSQNENVDNFFHPFANLTGLEQLILEDNKDLDLSGVGKHAFENITALLPSLHYLSFRGSSIKRVEHNLFWPLRNSSQLTDINLSSCELVSIASDSFVHLTNVQHIAFHENPKLLTVSTDIFNTPFLFALRSINLDTFENFGLAGNNLYTTPILLLDVVKDNLTSLDLSDNHLEFLGSMQEAIGIPAFPLMKNLETLKVRRSEIINVRPNTFDNLPNLKILDLSDNFITMFLKSLLVPTLEVIDLSYQYNQPAPIIYPFTFPDQIFHNANMTNLKKLYLSHTRMTDIPSGTFDGLDGLEVLDLENTNIATIADDAFAPLRNLKSLDLSYNVNLYHTTNKTFSSLANLERLNLAYSSYVFQADPPGYMSQNQDISSDSDNSFDNGMVNITNFLKLDNLKSLDLTCALNPNCSADFNYSSPLDPNLLLALPNLEDLNLSENSLVQWTDDRFVHNTKLSRLSLAKNQMVHITAGLLESFSRLKYLDFRDNPIICDHFVAHFVLMVDNKSNDNFTIEGWDGGQGYSCVNESDTSQIYTYRDYFKQYEWPTDIDPEPNYKAHMIIAFAVGTFLLVVLTGSFAYIVHRERFSISYKLLLTWHRAQKLVNPNQIEKKKMQPDVVIDVEAKKYDVFISYSEDDKEWVAKQMLPKLEREYGVKCCIHERDFQVGVAVMQNIVDCVDSSRKFIVVLSPGYVKSKWCMFELFLAQSRMLDQNPNSLSKSPPKRHLNNLIVIVKQKLDSGKIARRLQVMLRLWTYLEWPTSLSSVESEATRRQFWQRLASCLNTVRV